MRSLYLTTCQSNDSCTLATHTAPDGTAAQQQINHPQQTICVPPRKANAPLLPASMGTAASPETTRQRCGR